MRPLEEADYLKGKIFDDSGLLQCEGGISTTKQWKEERMRAWCGRPGFVANVATRYGQIDSSRNPSRMRNQGYLPAFAEWLARSLDCAISLTSSTPFLLWSNLSNFASMNFIHSCLEILPFLSVSMRSSSRLPHPPRVPVCPPASVPVAFVQRQTQPVPRPRFECSERAGKRMLSAALRTIREIEAN